MEILAPAGSFESVISAVNNGANAVYLGQQKFNARKNAENFDYETLKKAVEYCHIRNVKVYQTLNTIIFDDELNDLIETIKIACELNIDALIVQDLGVLNIIKKVCKNINIHASTQMTVHTIKGAEFLKNLGIKRIVVSRELSLREIKEIIDNVDVEIEVFGHGALCMSVSGQCYMSAMIGGRSGNKGNCAGTCRLPFGVNNSNDYDLSLKDLCSTSYYDKLKEIGVTSLKIEGRMKRPEYTAITSKTYSLLEQNLTADTNTLRAVFSRSGFTDGYLSGKLNGDMFGYRNKDDVLSATDEILSNLRESYRKENQIIPLNVDISILNDKQIEIIVNDNSDNTIKLYSDKPEIAINKPTTQEMVIESLSKLGGTPFYINNINVSIDDGLIVAKSKLNAIRREFVEQISILRNKPYNYEFKQIKITKNSIRKIKNQSLRARYSSIDQISQNALNSLEYIYLPIDEVIDNQDILCDYSDKIIIELDRVSFGIENKLIDKLNLLSQLGFKNISASNISHIQIGKELNLNIFGTNFLNTTNSESLEFLQKYNLKDTIISTELTCKQIDYLKDFNNFKTGILGYGYLPLMIVRNCPIKRHIKCSECKSKNSLTDRLSNKFRVTCNRQKYSEILNSKPLILSDKLNDFNKVDFITLYFTIENKSECDKVINAYKTKSSLNTKDLTRGLYYRGIN